MTRGFASAARTQAQPDRASRRVAAAGPPVQAGFLHSRGGLREIPPRPVEHGIHVILNGAATYQIEGAGDVTTRAGEIVILPAGVQYSTVAGGRFDLAFLRVRPEVLDRLAGLPDSLQMASARLRKRIPPYRKIMVPEANQRLEWLVEDVIAERKRKGPGHEAMLEALAVQAAVHLLRLAQARHTGTDDTLGAQRVRIALDWTNRHFAEPCSVQWLAGMARMAPTYFAARFQEIVGTPPMAYVRALRMRSARDLLERTDLPVKVVAASVGYADASHFNHVFRRTQGESPVGFRSRNKDERSCAASGLGP